MPTTHGHRKYTMSKAALAQRAAARKNVVYIKNRRPSRAGVTIGLHITPKAKSIVESYGQGRPRREFLTSAIINAKRG